MTVKTKSKYLQSLETYLAGQNPALLQAVKIFQDLDQIEYDLGLIDTEDSTASKISWWPVITIIGSSTSGKAAFFNQYLKTDQALAVGQNKLTVFQHSQNDQAITLPGTALDGDPRFPFYRISDKIERIRKGEGGRINNYLELKSSSNSRLQDKILLNTPDLTEVNDEIPLFLTRYVLDISDLLLIFIEADPVKLDATLFNLQQLFSGDDQRNPNKIIYIVNQEPGAIDNTLAERTMTLLKEKLADTGVSAEQFIFLTNEKAPVAAAPTSNSILDQIAGKQNSAPQSVGNNQNLLLIEERMANVNVHRAYEILNSLEKSIREVEEMIVPEIRNGIELWKERVHFTDALIMGFFASLLVFAEINTGIILASLVDPLVLSIALGAIILFMLPVHIMSSKAHGKLIINNLNLRSKELGLIENLSAVFEKHLNFWMMLLPKKAPVGWNKATKANLESLLQRTKDLVQSLNDGFSTSYRG